MRKKIEITREDFDGLMGWLSPDSDEAGKKYLQIRDGLTRYFRWRGAMDAEYLADETLSRVVGKISSVKRDEKFNLEAYFYSFAANVFREDFRQRKRLVYDYEDLELIPTNDEQEKNNPAAVCLERCLAEHSPADRSLLINYYGYDAHERAGERKKLAQAHRISVEFLHTKVSRLKKLLRACLKNCLGEKK